MENEQCSVYDPLVLAAYLRRLADEIKERGVRSLFWVINYDTRTSGHCSDSLGRLWRLSTQTGGRKVAISLKWDLGEDKLLGVEND